MNLRLLCGALAVLGISSVGVAGASGAAAPSGVAPSGPYHFFVLKRGSSVDGYLTFRTKPAMSQRNGNFQLSVRLNGHGGVITASGRPRGCYAAHFYPGVMTGVSTGSSVKISFFDRKSKQHLSDATVTAKATRKVGGAPGC